MCKINNGVAGVNRGAILSIEGEEQGAQPTALRESVLSLMVADQ